MHVKKREEKDGFDWCMLERKEEHTENLMSEKEKGEEQKV